jgi:hypothetical protein
VHLSLVVTADSCAAIQPAWQPIHDNHPSHPCICLILQAEHTVACRVASVSTAKLAGLRLAYSTQSSAFPCPASNLHARQTACQLLCLPAMLVLLAGKHRMWASSAWGGLSIIAGSLVAQRGLGAGWVPASVCTAWQQCWWCNPAGIIAAERAGRMHSTRCASCPGCTSPNDWLPLLGN